MIINSLLFNDLSYFVDFIVTVLLISLFVIFLSVWLGDDTCFQIIIIKLAND